MPRLGGGTSSTANAQTVEADANLIPTIESLGHSQGWKSSVESAIQTVFFSDLFETNVFSGTVNPYVKSWLTGAFYPEYEDDYWRWMARKWFRVYRFLPLVIGAIVIMSFLLAIFVNSDAYANPGGVHFRTLVILNAVTVLICLLVWSGCFSRGYLPFHMRYIMPILTGLYTFSQLFYDNCSGRYTAQKDPADTIMDTNILYLWIPFVLTPRWVYAFWVQVVSIGLWAVLSLTIPEGTCHVDKTHHQIIYLNMISLSMAFAVGVATNVIIECYFRKLYLVDLAVRHRDRTVDKDAIIDVRGDPFPANVKTFALTFINQGLERRYRQFFWRRARPGVLLFNTLNLTGYLGLGLVDFYIYRLDHIKLSTLERLLIIRYLVFGPLILLPYILTFFSSYKTYETLGIWLNTCISGAYLVMALTVFHESDTLIGSIYVASLLRSLANMFVTADLRVRNTTTSVFCCEVFFLLYLISRGRTDVASGKAIALIVLPALGVPVGYLVEKNARNIYYKIDMLRREGGDVVFRSFSL